MILEYKECLKIDLDIQDKQEAIEQINSRLSFLVKIDMFKWSYIKRVELLYKTTYSCRIFLNIGIPDKKDIIILQAILGGDYKHLGIIHRDLHLGITDWNRLFTIKRYVDGSYITAEIIDITDLILCKEDYEN